MLPLSGLGIYPPQMTTIIRQSHICLTGFIKTGKVKITIIGSNNLTVNFALTLTYRTNSLALKFTDHIPHHRWLTSSILFVTIHTVSTNNGRMDILKDDIGLALSMVDARDEANRVWLEDAFTLGKQQNVRALVIITQADPTAADGSGECTAYRRMHCDAFADLRDDVVRLSKGFFPSYKDTRLRPVLFMHGDTGPFCFDKTFGGDAAPNLWRLNAWGDFTVPADATVVTVQPENKGEPFAAITLLERTVPGENCLPKF
mgnify:CR=1 FL=1